MGWQAPELFTRHSIRPPRGVLLHGPPGTGKTVLACAAARDAGARLLVLNGADVLSEFAGDSEAGLTGVATIPSHDESCVIDMHEAEISAVCICSACL